MKTTIPEEDRYAALGVSSTKTEVHKAIKQLDKGIFPNAFCKIMPDIFTDDPNYCLIQHADGTGTKILVGYLIWKLTGDASVWKKEVLNALIMNTDDLACVNATDRYLVTLIINRNASLIPEEVISGLIEGCNEFCQKFLKSEGVMCRYAGGETADVGDQVRTLTVDNVITTRMLRSSVIDAGNIRPHSCLVSFSSTGQARWESEPNSGGRSNGYTLGRHEVLSAYYQGFKETYAPETPIDKIYSGDYRLEDPLPGDDSFTIGSALSSPTRTYLPLVRKLAAELGHKRISGLIHCSGGGQTKISNFGPPNVHYVKENPFPLPPLFKLFKNARDLSMRQMLKAYSCGGGLELVTPDEGVAKMAIAISEEEGIAARMSGETIPSDGKDTSNRVSIKTDEGWVNYTPNDLK